jgi:integrase
MSLTTLSMELSFRRGEYHGDSFSRGTKSDESWQRRRSRIARSIGSPRSLGYAPAKICGLCLDDIDFDSGVIHIRQSAWRGKLQEPKTPNSIRALAFSPNLASHLRGFLATWRPNPSQLLFATRSGTPFDQNLIVKRKLHPLLAKLEIGRCGLHAFRHFAASMMDRLNAPLKLREQRLGHSDAAMTLGVYSHVAKEDDLRIAAQLGEILDPSGPFRKNEGLAPSRQALVN